MSPPVRRVSAAEIRRIFNDGLYLERVGQGRLRAEVAQEWPAPPRANQVSGTMSQLVHYYDGTVLVAKVHQYLQPDGALGGSGLPDPKWLLHEGIVYCAV